MENVRERIEKNQITSKSSPPMGLFSQYYVDIQF